MEYDGTENYWTFEATDVHVPAMGKVSGDVSSEAVNL